MGRLLELLSQGEKNTIAEKMASGHESKQANMQGIFD